MSRPFTTVIFVALLGTTGLNSNAFAQTGCQPTITRPCPKGAEKPTEQAPRRSNAATSDQSNAPIDHSPRIRLDKDTDFKFGTGGLGLQRKF
jgi:hypothetical protein